MALKPSTEIAANFTGVERYAALRIESFRFEVKKVKSSHAIKVSISGKIKVEFY